MKHSSTPALLRISGLPAETMERFASPRCSQIVHLLLQLEDELTRAHNSVVDRLFQLIHDSPPELRRPLLALKRDCYNGRSLAKWRSSPAWPLIRELSPHLLDEVLELEERLAAQRDRLSQTFYLEREREREGLRDLIENQNFKRGLALAAPTLFQNLGRFQHSHSYGRKERGLEQSLLRYASRTAFKLSPFSTFTRIALGGLSDGVTDAAIHLLDGAWRQRTLLRPKRHIVSHYYEMLLHHPSFRGNLQITVNNTVERISVTRYRFIRPNRVIYDLESRTFKALKHSLVHVTLEGPVIDHARKALMDGTSTYSQLTSLLTETVAGSPEEVTEIIDTLLNLGFLRLLPPWSSSDFSPEQRLQEYLRGLPGPDFRAFLVVLDTILDLKSSYEEESSSEGILKEIEAAITEGSRALEDLLLQSRASQSPVVAKYLNEDVFLVPDEGTQDRELARIPTHAVERVVSSVRPLLRFANLFAQRHDFLHTLRASIAARWPGRQQVGFIDVFEAMQPLWREYRAFLNENSNGRTPSWNPLELPQISELQELRNFMWEELTSLFRSDSKEHFASPDDLNQLLDRIPDQYEPAVGPCLFVQPVDQRGDLWVANRILEGTGRYGSRYTTVMTDEMRRRYTEHAMLCSFIQLGGRAAELVDMISGRGNNLNVHAIQTPRVLEFPGEDIREGEAARLSLRDIRVQIDGPGLLPILLDSEGSRILPTHLGTVNLRLMPPLTRFLAQFGPGEYGYPIPPLPHRQQEEAKVYPRIRIGSLLMRRKRWVFPSDSLRRMLDHRSDSQRYETLNRWRIEHEIPEHVFVSEKLPAKFFGQEVYKPQHLNFTSPLYLGVFLTVLGSSGEQLTFEEMLPTPEMFPADRTGRRWAIEAQLDSHFLNYKAALPLAQATPATASIDHGG